MVLQEKGRKILLVLPARRLAGRVYPVKKIWGFLVRG
jgi:hypothetical protein